MTSSYLSPEERQRRIERNRKRLELARERPGQLTQVPEPEFYREAGRGAGRLALGGLKKLYTGVVKPILEKPAVQTYLEYPRAATTEVIQQVGEARDVMRERGVLSGLGHIGREQASTLLDMASTTAVGRWRIPEEWGEQLDPSTETAMGLELEDAKEEFRKVEGRDPTLVELYELKAPIQDKYMPWLTERWGPMSKRFALELGGEAVAGALEVVATGGFALAAKVPLATAAKLSATAGTKAFLQRAALQGVGQALKGPAYVDRLMGIVMGPFIKAPFRLVGFAVKAPFRVAGLGVRGATRVPGLTTATLAFLGRQQRRIFRAQGVADADAYAGVKRSLDAVTEKENLPNVTPGQLADTSVDGVVVPKLWHGHNQILKDMTAPKLPAAPRGLNGLSRRALDLVRDMNEDLSFFLSDELRIAFANSKLPFLKNIETKFKQSRPTPEDRYHQQAARDVNRAIDRWKDGWLTKKESAVANARRTTTYLMRLLDEQAPGLVVHSGKKSGKIARDASKQVSKDVDLQSGAELTDAYKPTQPTNYRFSDQYFKDNNITLDDGSVATMLGHTPVANPLRDAKNYRLVHAAKGGVSRQNQWGETVADDLFPMWDQVMERYIRYETPLSLVPITLDGRRTNAYEIVTKLADEGKRIEKAEMDMGTPNVGNRPYVLYKEGLGNYPRGPIGRIKEGEPGVLYKGEFSEEAIRFGVEGPAKVHHADYISSAEAYMDGVVYPHPAMALADTIETMYNRARLKAIGSLVGEASQQYGIKVTTLEDLLASKITTQLKGDLDMVSSILNIVVGRIRDKTAREGIRGGELRTHPRSPCHAYCEGGG
jgi:hypothetical protein